MELDGKIALVTGASRGVGAATAVALAQQGCRVACAARSTTAHPQPTPGTLDGTVAAIDEIGGAAIPIPTNLAKDDEIRAMVARTVEQFGGLDILINNAAVTFVGDMRIDEERHDLVMAVNFHAPYLAIRQAIPHLRQSEDASILNVSSVAALFPHSGLNSYGISKAALERLTIGAAVDLAPDNIAVNCFRIDVPVASEGFVANMPDADQSDWEPPVVAAEGIVWMLQQGAKYTGHLESMAALREREGIMASQAERPFDAIPPMATVSASDKAWPL